MQQQEFLGNMGYQRRDIKVQLMKGAQVPGHTSKGWLGCGNQGREGEYMTKEISKRACDLPW